MNAGDHLSLFDNSGAEYPATIVASAKSRVDVAVGLALTPPVESPVHITLWHGLCRGGRMDTVVQKALPASPAQLPSILRRFCE